MDEARNMTEDAAAEEAKTEATNEDLEDLLIRAYLVSTSYAARRNDVRRCSDPFRV
jgi:hypothetical protein